MKTSIFNLNGLTLASYAVGILAFIFIYAFWTDKKIPLITSDKAAFILLWIIGLAMSILAGTRDCPDGQFMITGIVMTILMVLGALAFGVLFLKLIGVKLPGIMSYGQAFKLIAGIIIVKWLIVHLYKLWLLFQSFLA